MKIDFSSRELQMMITVLSKHTRSVENDYKDHLNENGRFDKEYLDDLEILHTLESRFNSYWNWHKDDTLTVNKRFVFVSTSTLDALLLGALKTKLNEVNDEFKLNMIRLLEQEA